MMLSENPAHCQQHFDENLLSRAFARVSELDAVPRGSLSLPKGETLAFKGMGDFYDSCSHAFLRSHFAII